MALSLKSLFSRKKRKRTEDDGDEPFFTGATLGPGLDDAGDDLGGTDAGQGGAGGDEPRDFDDILDDEDWDQEGEDGEEDDGVLGHGRKARRRIAIFAAIGLTAALAAGGGAWWMLQDDPGAAAPVAMTAENDEPADPAPAPSDRGASGTGSAVSLPMPKAPGLGQTLAGSRQAGGQQQADGAAGEQTAVLDPTAATDRSTDRRPWLTEDGAGEAPDPGAEAPQPAESGAAPADGSGDGLAGADGTEPEQAAGTQAGAEGADAGTAPADGAKGEMTEATEPAPSEEAGSGMTPSAPPGPKIDAPPMPDADTAESRKAPRYEELPTIAEDDRDPLEPAPIPALVRNTPNGPLPVAAPDGRKPWTAYARPFEADPATPRIAIIVDGLGMLPEATQAAINVLPPDITLAFDPYGFELPEVMRQARAAGHEVLMSLPLEDKGFPARDPGPLGLNTLLPVNENLIRLNKVLASGVGYTGVLGRGGETFSAKDELMTPVLEAIGRAGLLYVQPRRAVQLASTGDEPLPVPSARVDMKLDEDPFRDAVEARLAALETLARERGRAVAVVDPTPMAFAALLDWVPTLPEKGLVLTPVSAVVTP